MVEVSSWKFGFLFLAAAIITSYVYQRLYSLPLKMEGFSDQSFRDAARAFRQIIQSEDERGASFVVYHKGQRVLEMLGGYTDPQAELLWTPDTVTQVFSLSSVTAALSFLHLSQTGHFNHSVPVKDFWSEFEGDLTGTDLLQNKHQLYNLPNKVQIRDLIDNPEKVDDILKTGGNAAEDGFLDTKFFTSGLYLDALLRRSDPQHRPVSQYFHAEIAVPLALDAHLGLPRTQFSRAARVQYRLADGFWGALWSFDFGQMWRALGRNHWWNLVTEGTFEDYKLQWAMRPEAMEVGHPSLSLFANARSLGRLFGAIAGSGKLEGRQMLPAALFGDDFLTEDASGYDRVLSRRVAYNRAGFELHQSPAKTTMVGFYGFGGQFAFADLEKNVAIAYTTNHLHSCSAHSDWMQKLLIQAVYSCVDTANVQS